MPTTKRRIVDDELFAHFVTFTCYRRRRLLDYEHPKRILLGVLNHQLTSLSAKCVGFVIMPDHVHAIVWFPETGQLTRFMHGWKRMSSFRIRQWYRTEHPEYFKDFEEGDAFWQAKYYSFEIYSTEKLKEKLDYMHLNPVRIGLVQRAIEYKWSSARWYESRQSVGVPIEWIG